MLSYYKQKLNCNDNFVLSFTNLGLGGTQTKTTVAMKNKPSNTESRATTARARWLSNTLRQRQILKAICKTKMNEFSKDIKK